MVIPEELPAIRHRCKLAQSAVVEAAVPAGFEVTVPAEMPGLGWVRMALDDIPDLASELEEQFRKNDSMEDLLRAHGSIYDNLERYYMRLREDMLEMLALNVHLCEMVAGMDPGRGARIAQDVENARVAIGVCIARMEQAPRYPKAVELPTSVE